jgi:hypothetical protein
LAGEHKLGNGQYIVHAKKLINNEDVYSGKEFSWGDAKIFIVSQENEDSIHNKPGNAKNWVEYSQNHHITLIESLL